MIKLSTVGQSCHHSIHLSYAAIRQFASFCPRNQVSVQTLDAGIVEPRIHCSQKWKDEQFVSGNSFDRMFDSGCSMRGQWNSCTLRNNYHVDFVPQSVHFGSSRE